MKCPMCGRGGGLQVVAWEITASGSMRIYGPFNGYRAAQEWCALSPAAQLKLARIYPRADSESSDSK